MNKNLLLHIFKKLYKLSKQPFDNILCTLNSAICECYKRLDEVKPDDLTEYQETVNDDESLAIENFLGLAFICCQIRINRTFSKYLNVYNCIGGVNGENKNKSHIYKIKGNFEDYSYSGIQIIEGCANYFKHHEEWESDWGSDDKEIKNSRAKHTIELVRSLGFSESRTNLIKLVSDNFKQNGDYFSIIRKIINNWYEGLYNILEDQIKSEKHE